jgi:hypothetical protein
MLTPCEIARVLKPDGRLGLLFRTDRLHSGPLGHAHGCKIGGQCAGRPKPNCQHGALGSGAPARFMTGAKGGSIRTILYVSGALVTVALIAVTAVAASR